MNITITIPDEKLPAWNDRLANNGNATLQEFIQTLVDEETARTFEPWMVAKRSEFIPIADALLAAPKQVREGILNHAKAELGL